jgi:hypothetical protein
MYAQQVDVIVFRLQLLCVDLVDCAQCLSLPGKQHAAAHLDYPKRRASRVHVRLSNDERSFARPSSDVPCCTRAKLQHKKSHAPDTCA